LTAFTPNDRIALALAALILLATAPWYVPPMMMALLPLAVPVGVLYPAAILTLVFTTLKHRRSSPRPYMRGAALGLAAQWSSFAWSMYVLHANLDPLPAGWSLTVLSFVPLAAAALSVWAMRRWPPTPVATFACSLAMVSGAGMSYLVAALGITRDSL